MGPPGTHKTPCRRPYNQNHPFDNHAITLLEYSVIFRFRHSIPGAVDMTVGS